jgi:hypothetical protein
MSKTIAEFADKHDISDEKALQILHDVDTIKEIWEIRGLDDYILDIFDALKIKSK